MAEVAHGANCPKCGTFNAVGGSLADEQLGGMCGCCGTTIAMANPSYDPGVAAVVARKDAQLEALQAQLNALHAQIAEAKGEGPASAPNVGVPEAEPQAEPQALAAENGEPSEDVDDNPPEAPSGQ